MNIEKYETQDENNHLRYTFLSKGDKDIMKIIAYQKLARPIVLPIKGKISIFNLAFGDRVGESLEIDDKANSNNGDMWKVFNTVLHTIPTFFSKHTKAGIMVSGSDQRRIKAYCMHVSRNYETLTQEYTFYGTTGTSLTPFVKGTVYERVVFLPK